MAISASLSAVLAASWEGEITVNGNVQLTVDCNICFLVRLHSVHLETRKRYCETFVTVMKQISAQMGTREYATAVLRFSIEHPNLQQLLTDVLYTNEDTYHFYMEVVDSCSDVIEKFMCCEYDTYCVLYAVVSFYMSALWFPSCCQYSNAKGCISFT